MKHILFVGIIFFTLNIFATQAPQKIISVDNEIKVVEKKSESEKTGFEIINIKKDSIYNKIGYKNGDTIKSIKGLNITNTKQLKAALDSQATDWENDEFDDDFSEGDVDIDDKSFEELEAELAL